MNHMMVDALSEGLELVLLQAAVDADFARELLAAPAQAAASFELTEAELTALTSVRAGTKEELAEQLLRAWRNRGPTSSFSDLISLDQPTRPLPDVSALDDLDESVASPLVAAPPAPAAAAPRPATLRGGGRR